MLKSGENRIKFGCRQRRRRWETSTEIENNENCFFNYFNNLNFQFSFIFPECFGDRFCSWQKLSMGAWKRAVLLAEAYRILFASMSNCYCVANTYNFFKISVQKQWWLSRSWWNAHKRLNKQQMKTFRDSSWLIDVRFNLNLFWHYVVALSALTYCDYSVLHGDSLQWRLSVRGEVHCMHSCTHINGFE